MQVRIKYSNGQDEPEFRAKTQKESQMDIQITNRKSKDRAQNNLAVKRLMMNKKKFQEFNKSLEEDIY